MNLIKSLLATVALACACLASCSSSPHKPNILDAFALTGAVEFSGDASVFTNGNVTVAVGQADGSASIHLGRDGAPVVIPFSVDEASVYVDNRRLGVSAHRIPRGEPLPYWALDVIPQAAVDRFQFTFDSPPEVPNSTPSKQKD